MDILRIQALIAEGKLVNISDLTPSDVYVQIGVYEKGNRKLGASNFNAYPSFVVSLQDILASAGGGGGGAPTGPAGGNLTGTYPNPGVNWSAGLTTYNTQYYPLSSNPAGYLTSASLPFDGTYVVGIDLNTTAVQTLLTLPAGSYIVDSVYVHSANADLSASPVRELTISNSGIPLPAPYNTSAAVLFTSLDPGPCPIPNPCPDYLNSIVLPEMYVPLLVSQPQCFPPPCGPYIITGGETLNAQLTVPTGVPAKATLTIIVRKIA